MKLVSLVPSHTETLLECGINVVGRTRFCVHPKNLIPVVGGTKQVDWEKVKELAPDFVLLDKEENTREMAMTCPFPSLITHVTSLASLAGDLRMLGEAMGNGKLSALATKAEAFQPRLTTPIPALNPLRPPDYSRIQTILYLVWRDPWIAVSRETFIGDMLAHMGHELPTFPERYPRVRLENYDPATTLLLLSSEPYPFAKKAQEMQALGFPALIVDGEAFGWFGIRSLNFLDQALRQASHCP